uniref:Uncharacterized protein n=1 Tax=Utricularia reniformis TaxID=192314 RepID=A0A1Y0B3Q8_9LAMI|nr:hypothetical protein AEK19_MT1919 [Utricularia reniformis]ART32086.1 hypothetical protein AEK19_MT1919 [Utricularia reniformis]
MFEGLKTYKRRQGSCFQRIQSFRIDGFEMRLFMRMNENRPGSSYY